MSGDEKKISANQEIPKEIARVSYGGIVSAGFYDNVLYPSEGQEASDR